MAPWNFTISAQLPSAPATLPVYRVLSTPAVSPADLQDVFGVSGTPEWMDAFGGFDLVSDGRTRLYSFDHGGSAFHDLGLTPGTNRIRTVSDDVLWRSSEELLADLGLFDNPIVSLSPGRIGGCVAERVADTGVTASRWSCGQAASWDMGIDAWPTFGPGSDMTVRFGDRGVIFAFEETVRNLTVQAELPTLSAKEAVSSWLSRGAQTHRWNMLRTAA